MPLKTNVNNDINDALERKMKELSINNKLKIFQERYPDINQETIQQLQAILEKQDDIDLDKAIKELELV